MTMYIYAVIMYSEIKTERSALIMKMKKMLALILALCLIVTDRKSVV